MLPISRNKLRLLERSLMDFLRDEDLLYVEKDWINDALTLLIKADYFVSHSGFCHTKLKSFENGN